MEQGVDLARFDLLVRQQLPATLRMAAGLTGDADWAEEVVQEALCRAVVHRKSFRGESEFRTWLTRIVINAFRDQLKSRKRTDAAELPSDAADGRAIDPGRAAVAEEVEREVARRVSALPPRQREAIVLVAYENLTPREAAEAMGVSPANLYATLHVARERLKKELAPFLNEL